MPSDQESRRRVRHILEQDVSQVALDAVLFGYNSGNRRAAGGHVIIQGTRVGPVTVV